MTVLVVLGALVSIFGLIAFSSIWSGYVLSIMWGWFIVPVFHLPAMSIPVAIGVALVISFTTHQTNTQKDDRSFGDAFLYAITHATIKSAVVLFVGWIVTHWL